MIDLNPVVLGSGKPLFKDIDDKIDLKLLGSKVLNSGVVGLDYKPQLEEK